MHKHQWFIHLQGASIGPLSTDNVVLMLQQNRLQFVDYIWTNSLTKWHRICDLDEFAALVPAYPKVSIPKSVAEKINSAPSSYVVDPPEAEEVPASADSPKPTVRKSEPSAHKQVQHEPAASKSKFKISQTRTYRRIFNPDVKVSIEDRLFKAINLSETGILLSAEKPLDVGLEIELDLTLPEEKILKLTAVVIRHENSEKGKGFAIEFTRVNPAHKRLLREYVEKCSS